MKKILENFNKGLDELFEGFTTFGIITGVIDILVSIIVIILIARILKMKFKTNKIILLAIVILLIYTIAFFFGMEIFSAILKYLSFWMFGIIIIVYSEEIKQTLNLTIHEGVSGKKFSSELEKDKLIDCLMTTSQKLASRRTGALIVLEGKANLNTIIDKSIVINADVNEEILTTLFYPGTVTHDGAVIVRYNTIVCAGAYLPTTDRYDVPKELGTRHRAAIGLSEKYDAITIVVSEETRKISIAFNGRIEIGIDQEKFKEMLNNFYINK